VAGDLFGFTADFGFAADVSASQPITVTFWLHRGCALGRTDMASALGRCNNLPSLKVT